MNRRSTKVKIHHAIPNSKISANYSGSFLSKTYGQEPKYREGKDLGLGHKSPGPDKTEGHAQT
jgi:hypothetical protein